METHLATGSMFFFSHPPEYRSPSSTASGAAAGKSHSGHSSTSAPVRTWIGWENLTRKAWSTWHQRLSFRRREPQLNQFWEEKESVTRWRMGIKQPKIGGFTTVLTTNGDVTHSKQQQQLYNACATQRRNVYDIVPGKSLHKVISRNHVDHSCVSWLKNCIWVKAMVILPSLRGWPSSTIGDIL